MTTGGVPPRRPGPGVLRRFALAALALAAAACADAVAPERASLAGRWIVTDTVDYHYIASFDASERANALTFNVTIDVQQVTDTSYWFHAADGTQTTYDTIAGQAQPPVTTSQDGLWGYVFVVGDTAHVTILGKLDLTGWTGDAIASRGYLPTPECLANLGGLARPSPAPSCLHTHNWVRAP